MMFKNLLVYRFEGALDLAKVEDAFSDNSFTPCGATQERSSGWTFPRGNENGQLVESINGHWIARFMVETKTVPASVLNAEVDRLCEVIEATKGRKPGRKEREDLKEEVRLSLLPQAFAKRQSFWVWFDLARGLLMIDASSPAKADAVITALVEQIQGLRVFMYQTESSPSAAMATWLQVQSATHGFTLGDECELKSQDETKATVKYANHSLEIEEIRGHLVAGKRPTRLSMGYDGSVSFVLTDAMQIKKIKINDMANLEKDDTKDCFDADVALATGELSLMIQSLINALNGVEEPF